MLLAGGLAKGSFMETLLFLWQPTNKVHWQSTKSTKDLRLSRRSRGRRDDAAYPCPGAPLATGN